MNLSRSDVVSLATQIGGGCALAVSAGLGPAIDAIAPGWGQRTLAILGLVSIIAGIIVRTMTNPTPTNTAVVFDHSTGSAVSIKTVAPSGGAWPISPLPPVPAAAVPPAPATPPPPIP